MRSTKQPERVDTFATLPSNSLERVQGGQWAGWSEWGEIGTWFLDQFSQKEGMGGKELDEERWY